MFEWLETSWAGDVDVSPGYLVMRLGASLVAGCVVAGIYRATRGAEAIAPSFVPTLILLSVLIAMVTQVVGNHVARAFSLVGALSIVRFRTVVETTHDIAFVIFAVVVGMAVGADHLLVAVIGSFFVGLAAWIFRPHRGRLRWSQGSSTLALRLGIGHGSNVLEPIFDRYLATHDLIACSTARQGSALDLTYRVQLRADGDPALVLNELNQIEGIQSVELRRD